MNGRSRFWLFALLTPVVSIVLSGCASRFIQSIHRIPLESCEVKGFHIQTYAYPRGGASLEIEKSGVVVYSMFELHGGIYIGGETGDTDDEARAIQVEPGTDVLGSGKPNLIITRWAWEGGGKDRKYTDYIFELTDTLVLSRKLQGVFYYKELNDSGLYSIYEVKE